MRTGGCLCGALRYRVQGDPAFTDLSTYEQRSDESGRWIRLDFCPRCGTTVTSTFEKGPKETAILGGTFDDTTWIRVDRQVWTRSRQHWFALPEGIRAFEKSSSAS